MTLFKWWWNDEVLCIHTFWWLQTVLHTTVLNNPMPLVCRSHIFPLGLPLDVSKVTVRWPKRVPSLKEFVVALLYRDVIPKGDIHPEECHLKIFVLSPTCIRKCSYFTGHLVS